MSAQPSFECRILAGLHQGASALLSPTSDTYSVGTGSDADIVLRDLPVSTAQIRVDAQSWSWTDPEYAFTLALGEALDLGGVTLQICRAGDVWPASPTPARVQRRPSARDADTTDRDNAADDAISEPASEATIATASADEDTDAAHAAGDERDPSALSAPTNRAAPAMRRSRSRLAQVLVIIALAAAAGLPLAGAWIASTPEESSEAPAAAAAAEPAPAAATEAELAAIEALIVEQEMQDRIEASLNDETGRIEIAGVVADDDALENLVRAVRKVAQRVAMRVLTQADFAGEVAALQDDLPPDVKIASKPVGTVTLEGIVADDAERESLIVQVESALPMAAEIYVDIKTRTDLALEKRRQQKTAEVIPDPPLPQLMAVVSGPEPFLVMPNGDRIMVGGMVNGLTVMAISNTHIDYQLGNGKLLRAAR